MFALRSQRLPHSKTMQAILDKYLFQIVLVGSAIIAVGAFFIFSDNIPKTSSSETDIHYSTKKGSNVKTASGLEYTVIEEGTGESPKPDNYVTVHYEGTLEDGTVFDSSYKRGEPATFPANGVIAGWVEALSMMKVGAKWDLVIPAELGYGPQGAGDVIPPNAALKFTVELLKIQTIEELVAEFEATQITFLEDAEKTEGMQKTESGLLYTVVEEGAGAKPKGPTSEVTVHYAGRLTNGHEFDSSYKRNQPATFALNRVIAGWTEGLQLMSVGSKYTFIIPSTLGYGAQGSQGSIPPNATLIFEVELIDVKDAE